MIMMVGLRFMVEIVDTKRSGSSCIKTAILSSEEAWGATLVVRSSGGSWIRSKRFSLMAD